MADLLAWLEGSALAAWTRESPSIWAYPTILTLHTAGLSILVGAAAVVDLRMLGVAPRIPIAALRPLLPIAWGAFALNAATGFLLFMSDATSRAGQRVFQVKLGLIALAVLSTVVVGRFVEREPGLVGAATAQTPRIRLVAMLSLLLWIAAIAAGRLMAYL